MPALVGVEPVAREGGPRVQAWVKHVARVSRFGLVRARVRRAQHLLETTKRGVEQIAEDIGFASATVLREQFVRTIGTSPSAYRKAFASSDRRRR